MVLIGSSISFVIWTRATADFQSLIDLCIANTPDKIVRSRVLPLGISNNSLVYLISKTHYTIPGGVNIISARSGATSEYSDTNLHIL